MFEVRLDDIWWNEIIRDIIYGIILFEITFFFFYVKFEMFLFTLTSNSDMSNL